MNRNEIVALIEYFKRQKQDYTIWIVANVADTVQTHEDFIRHSNFSEFFTKAEFASIVSAITESFGYTRIFYSEIEFMEYVLAKKDSLNKLNLIVYNFARDGVHEGKKSLIPAFCDLFDIRYIGSNPFVISLLRNKYIYSILLKSMGIPVPFTSKHIYGKEFQINSFQKPYSLIAKNICESASIGMDEKNILANASALDISLSLDALCDRLQTKEILVQDYIKGIECEVFVVKYNNQYHAFDPIKLTLTNSDIITSQISDTYDYTFSLLSREISTDICNQIKSASEKAAELLNIDGYARFDYRINDVNNFYLIDIAGTPYLTRHSSITYLFTNVLQMQYSDIFIFLAAITMANYSKLVNCKSDNNNPLE